MKIHPDNIAFEDFLNSQMGQKSLKPFDGMKTKDIQYLRNRLWHAFIAGIRYIETKK